MARSVALPPRGVLQTITRFENMSWSTIRKWVRLRYQLLWAQARTSNGRYALFVVLYVLGVSGFLFLNLGGFGTAVAATRTGRGEQVARWMLSGLFLDGLVAGLMFGVGPRHAFSDAVMRRYPMSPTERLAARHLAGLCDPIWPLMLGLILGLCAGFAMSSPALVIVSMPASVLFVATCYLATAVLLGAADRLLQYRAGGMILGGLVFAAITGILFARTLIDSLRGRGWGQPADLVLRSLPPGATASLISGTGLLRGAIDAVLLLCWCVLLLVVLAALERRPPGSQSRARAAIRWESLSDRVAARFGPNLGPLVAKALRYHLRCNRVRLGLALAVPTFVILPRVLPVSHSEVAQNDLVYFFTLILFFAGSTSTMAITVNQFGFDGPGIQRYLSLPVPFSWALRAGSFASLILGQSVVLVALVVWWLVSGISIDLRMPVGLLSSGTAGLFLFNAAGLWTTALSPKSSDFRRVFGNYLSLGGNLVMVFQIVLLVMPLNLAIAGVITKRQILTHWPVLVLLVFICAGLYAASLYLIEPVLKRRRDRLVCLIAGTRLS